MLYLLMILMIIEGAACTLHKDAIKPNLVQTLENTPVIVHGGPFANIAHGCNSILATKMALKLSDYTITEAGFAADLGAEKFFDIKCRLAGLKPNCIVLVATIRALKHHGGASDINKEDLEALTKGFENLDKHIENMQKYNVPVVVAINKFVSDTDKEVECITKHCESKGVDISLCEVWAKGGEGAIDLSHKVLKAASEESNYKPLYELEKSIKEKIETICKEIYAAGEVKFSNKALKMMKKIENMGFGNLPICISKTQKSISDNPALLNAPKGYTLNIDEIKLASGAGFIIAMAGGIIDMPGLPKIPVACNIDIDEKKAFSQALDIFDSTVYLPHRVEVKSGTYKDIDDADIMVVCAGPLPNMNQTRMDTLGATIEVMKDIVGKIKNTKFAGIIINISNPAGISDLNLALKIGEMQILNRAVSTGNNVIKFKDTELDNLYKEYGTESSLIATFILAGSGYTNSKTCIITLTGNQKTVKIKNNNIYKRGKVFININGTYRKAVIWINKNGSWRRCI